MSNVYVLGSINMDMVITTPYIPKEGETLKGSNFFLNGGGKGANQAVASAKQNVPTYLIGNVGNDVFGKELYAKLCDYNVNCEYVYKLKNATTGVAMIIVHNSDNRIILDSGANYCVTTNQIDNALSKAKEGDIFVCQLENNIDAVIYGLKKAKEKKMITIFNPAPAKVLDSEIYCYVDYLILNETECEILSGIYPTSEEIAIKAYEKIKVGNLIITLGSKGSMYISDNKVLNVKANKVDAVDTTAAGDTFVGVLASSLAKGLDIEVALNYSSLCSSLTCLKKGAQQSIPTLNEVEEYKCKNC